MSSRGSVIIGRNDEGAMATAAFIIATEPRPRPQRARLRLVCR